MSFLGESLYYCNSLSWSLGDSPRWRKITPPGMIRGRQEDLSLLKLVNLVSFHSIKHFGCLFSVGEQGWAGGTGLAGWEGRDMHISSPLLLSHHMGSLWRAGISDPLLSPPLSPSLSCCRQQLVNSILAWYLYLYLHTCIYFTLYIFDILCMCVTHAHFT